MSDDIIKLLEEIQARDDNQFGCPTVEANQNGDCFATTTNGYVMTNGSGANDFGVVSVEPATPYASPPSGITWISGSAVYAPSAAVYTPESSRVIQATPPRLEDIFVEIAKVVQKKGNISEVRDILDRHKLKVIDHDGEVIYNSEWDTKLKKLDL